VAFLLGRPWWRGRRRSSGGHGPLLLPGETGRRWGATEARLPPLPRLSAGVVHVIAVFFPGVLWRPWRWLGEAVFGSPRRRSRLGAFLRRLLTASLRHRTGPYGSRAAAPPLLCFWCWIPLSCTPSGASPVVSLQAGARASIWRWMKAET
jgi:hypothetical protein